MSGGTCLIPYALEIRKKIVGIEVAYKIMWQTG